MKLPVVLLAASLLANAAAVVAVVIKPSLAPASVRNFFRASGSPADVSPANPGAAAASNPRAASSTSTRTHSGPRLWDALQSDDLGTLIARLRAAGFPAAAIRAIVGAQIQKRFADRMNALVRTVEDTPFWRPAPMNSMNNPKLMEERQQIYRERARLLRELLGPDTFAYSGDATAAQRRQFGDLPKSKIDAIERINEDYAEMLSQVRAATQGITLPEDREKIALLEREKRADLAAILTPAEFADYEMRTSPITMRIRAALTLMDATEAEFRAIFAAQQPFAAILYPERMTSGSDQMQLRREATTKMEAQLKAALGDTRANEFLRASNYEFQQLVQIAQRENLPASAAVRAYELRTTTSEESARIGSNHNLSNEDKRAALKTLAQNTALQLVATLGATGGQAYAQSASWLKAIEIGSVVTFEGTTTMFRSISSPTGPPPSTTLMFRTDSSTATPPPPPRN